MQAAVWMRMILIAGLCFIPLAPRAATPMVSTGLGYALALDSGGKVVSWGVNDAGQLGNGQADNRASPKQIAGIDRVVSVSAGEGFTIAVRSDGTAWGWGDNRAGSVGDGTRQNRTRPVQVVSIAGNIAAVEAGGAHSLALTTDGRVWAWGMGTYGQLGNGDTEDSSVPVGVTGLPAMQAVSAAAYHSLALARDGTVWTWGDNSFGQLGNGTTTESLVPLQVGGLPAIVAISTRALHNLALDANGRVWAWGYGAYGTLGDGTFIARRTAPALVPGLTGIIGIAAGNLISIALGADGSVWVWGDNGEAQFGSSRFVAEASPVKVTELAGLTGVVVGLNHVLARDASGALRAWGRNDQGQLGTGDVLDRATPASVTGLPAISRFATGFDHSVAVASDGTVWTWGNNATGQLGDVTEVGNSIPVAVLELRNVVSVSAGAIHALALDNDGKVWGWGGNTNFQAGGSTARNVLLPKLVSGLPAITAVAAGWNYSIALDADGGVWAWGLVPSSRSKVPTAAYATPYRWAQYGGTTAVSAGQTHIVALRADGAVWSLGRNDDGQLGDGTTTTDGVPVLARGLTDVVAVSAGSDHSLALDRSGKVWAWGKNSDGRLGDGTTISRLTPVQLSGISDAVAISAGADHSCAITRDGRLWTWGDATAGQLGYTTTSALVAEPAPVTTLDGFRSVSCGNEFSVAVRDDGTTWGWGRNYEGQVGDGTFVPRDQPSMIVNAAVTGALDLAPEVPNSVSGSVVPRVILQARKAGSIDNLYLDANLFLGAFGGEFASSGRFAASAYKIFVAAILPASLGGGVFVLDGGGSWGAYAGGPMPEYRNNVAGDPTEHYFMTILAGTSVNGLSGARIYVGWGTSYQDMVEKQLYRPIYEVPPAVAQ